MTINLHLILVVVALVFAALATMRRQNKHVDYFPLALALFLASLLV